MPRTSSVVKVEEVANTYDELLDDITDEEANDS